ncbi:hypothetical protein CONLIGDRAFT_643270 [Coniochaeta ligniaria NRRL 30616]|uniref:Uncharacterized protein n=1 Tax=Coniochaeta ligniaria NRRL 30616 TaxID=1408157 RepID=A0A1J7IVD1_9PEZI|nr:hypothetical protein CONLIGDRAFT_643270 [Coniochaeta ligniaria NRRL 30616]
MVRETGYGSVNTSTQLSLNSYAIFSRATAEEVSRALVQPRVPWPYADAVLPHLQHRTVSTDYVVVQEGSPTYVTPEGPFSVVDGKGTYQNVRETLCKPGDVIAQRGSMHA